MKVQIENYIRKVLKEMLKSYYEGEYGAFGAFSVVKHDLEIMIKEEAESFHCQTCQQEIGRIEAEVHGNKCFYHYFDEDSPEITKILRTEEEE